MSLGCTLCARACGVLDAMSARFVLCLRSVCQVDADQNAMCRWGMWVEALSVDLFLVGHSGCAVGVFEKVRLEEKSV